jgi:hypothetical protein
MQRVLETREGEAKASLAQRRILSSHVIEVAYVVHKFLLHFTLNVMSVVSRAKNNKQVESLNGLLHNPLAFTSPVDEVVAWGEDTWP